MLDVLGQLHSLSWIYSALLWIALASTILIIIIILSENRNPVKSLAWVTVLLLLPVVGLVLYLFFGRNIKNTRMISRRNRRRLRRREKAVKSDPRREGLSNESVQQINLGRSLTGAQYYPGNSVSIFHCGKEKFDALKDDLRQATKSINFQYYIIKRRRHRQRNSRHTHRTRRCRRGCEGDLRPRGFLQHIQRIFQSACAAEACP